MILVGILIMVLAAIALEASNSLGKWEIAHKKETIYSMGFISSFPAMLIFMAIAIFFTKDGLTLAPESIPLVATRLLCEIILMEVAIRAIKVSDRTTHSFIRIITIPLLVIVDFIIGYSLTPTQLIGILIVLLTLSVLFLKQSINKKGWQLSLASAVLAVVTISIFKYNITFHNSVAAESAFMLTGLSLYTLIMSIILKHEHPLNLLSKKPFIWQSLLRLFSYITISYGFLFGPASVLTTSLRSSSIIASIVAGKKIFHETNTHHKYIASIFIILGIIVLTI